MKKILIGVFTLFAVFSTVEAKSNKEQDRVLIDKVAMWQVNHQPQVKHHDLEWTNAVLFRGMVEWADYTQDSRYYDFLMQIGKKHSWAFLKRLYHADDLVIAQMYIRMYEKFRDPAMIRSTIARVDSIIANPSKARLWLGAKRWSERWSWCDALFMAPPVYGQLNKLYPEKNYLDFMDREFKEATDSLYDKDAKLYYRDRRYIPRKEKNGEKVFWGRGNGWVAAGMAEVLRYLPESSPYHLPIVRGFQRMMASLKNYQTEEGMWRQLIDKPDCWVETSGSAMFTYAFIMGVKYGWLPVKEYGEATRRAWLAMLTYINSNDKVREVCVGTNKKNDMQYYYDRPRNTGDYHGHAPYLWCTVALLEK